MKDRYPYQSVGPSQRDYQELLASFRQLSDERNALRSIVERLHEALESVPDTGSPRSHLPFAALTRRGAEPADVNAQACVDFHHPSRSPTLAVVHRHR